MTKIVNEESVFLYGDLEEEIYECPQGMSDVGKDDCIILNKNIWPCTSNRQYNKKAVQILKKSGFIGGNVNPCLYVKKNEKGGLYIALYIYDNILMGDI